MKLIKLKVKILNLLSKANFNVFPVNLASISSALDQLIKPSINKALTEVAFQIDFIFVEELKK